MTTVNRRDARVPALLLTLAAVLGGVAGFLLTPGGDSLVFLALLAQLIATVVVWRAGNRPVVGTVVVLLVTLGAALEPTLREQLYVGAFPWVPLAQALTTANLVRRARSATELTLGVVSLCGTGATVTAVAVLAGGPLVPNLLAASVPVLGGALVAMVQRLNEARHDRLARPSRTAATGEHAPEVARQALLLVALRAETHLNAARDEDAAAQARDLRTVALQGLDIPRAATSPRMSVRISVRNEDEREPEEGHDSTVERDDAVPSLNARDREITRLLATGAANAQIARELYLSEATIKGHMSRLMRRFDCENRTQLALLAARWAD